MRNKKKYKKPLTWFGLFGISTMIGIFATSCATVDTPVFRQISLQDFGPENKRQFREITNIPSPTVKNLVYGTTAYNNGNYVLTLATTTNLAQYQFINGTSPGIGDLWLGEWAQAVRNITNRYNTSVQNGYPNGIKFGLFIDQTPPGTSGDEQWNPLSRFPDKRKDERATDAEKKRSNKLRRNDQSAQVYRDVFNLIQQTYGSSVSGWLNSSNVRSEDPSVEVTKVAVIAFRNVMGKVTAHFYNGSAPTPPASTNPPASATPPASASTNPQSFTQKQQALTLPSGFFTFLDGVYK